MSVENVENDELDDEYDDDTSSQLGTLSLRNSLPTGHGPDYLEENVGKGYNTATARRLRKVVLGKLWRLEQRRTGSFQVFISRLVTAIGVFRWLICITGSRIKMSTVKLQSECLPSRENTILVTCITSGTLVGHAFATTWDYGEGRLPPSTFFPTSQAYPIHVGTVCWITQLVVRKDQ